MQLSIDLETSVKNRGHVYTPENFIVSAHMAEDGKPVAMAHYLDADFLSTIRRSVTRSSELVLFNGKFDLGWLARYGVLPPPGCKIFDCSLAEYVLTGQAASFASLNECLTEYGLELKKDVVKEYWEAGVDTPDIPIAILEEYGNWDTHQTRELAAIQKSLLTEKQLNLVYIMGEDMLTLIEAESAGVKFNLEEAQKSLDKHKASVLQYKNELDKWLPEMPGTAQFNWNSGDQLSCLLYGGTLDYVWSVPIQAVYKSGPNKGQEYTKNSWTTTPITFPALFKPIERSETSKTKDNPQATTRFYQTDDPTLRQLKATAKTRPLLDALAKSAKAQKVVETIEGYMKLFATYGWQDNFLHPQYNQNVARTGRLSSSRPNSQNSAPEIDLLLETRY